MKLGDRILGIVVGLLLGAGIVVAFVFYGSEETIDAPSLSENGSRDGGGNGGAPAPPAVETVEVVGGAPPASGPPTLDYERGDQVRIRVVSDTDVGLELIGYGIAETVAGGQPGLIEFEATKPGNFPLVVSASHIGVATVRVAD